MKHIENKIEKIGSAFLIIIVFWVISSCGDLTTNEMESKLATTTSQVDGNPIINISAKDFYEHDFTEAYRDKIVARYGSQLVKAINQETQRAKVNGEIADRTILLKDLKINKAKVSSPFSSHIRLLEPNGEYEDFALGVRRYIQNPRSTSAKIAGKSLLVEDNVWLALSPDRFYLQDDDKGNELWPVTFDAINVADPNEFIEVTFDKNGFVSSNLEQNSKFKSADAPDILFVETMYIQDDCGNNDCLPDPPPPPPGDDGGTGGEPTNVNSRGGSTGTYGYNHIYFGIKNLRLASAGDGDGNLEIQMFTIQNDDYSGYKMPVSYRYRFDTAIRNDPINSWSEDTFIKGADRDGPKNRYYLVPDVNSSGINYDFDGNRRYVYEGPTNDYEQPEYTPMFPLFNLTQESGPWRLVLIEDDKDYPDHSRNNDTNHAQSVTTFDLETGVWSSVFTWFTTKSHLFGSSDDVMDKSGVRKITEANAYKRISYGDSFTASKTYSSGTFKYDFQMTTLNN